MPYHSLLNTWESNEKEDAVEYYVILWGYSSWTDSNVCFSRTTDHFCFVHLQFPGFQLSGVRRQREVKFRVAYKAQWFSAIYKNSTISPGEIFVMILCILLGTLLAWIIMCRNQAWPSPWENMKLKNGFFFNTYKFMFWCHTHVSNFSNRIVIQHETK